MTFGKSADGKGRTLWQWLTGGNRALTPMEEFNRRNFLGAKSDSLVLVGDTNTALNGDYVVDRVTVWESPILGESYFHVDYDLHGRRERVKLRALPNESATNGFGHDFLVLEKAAELGYQEGVDSGFIDTLSDPDGLIHIIEDADGVVYPYGEGPHYWRVGGVLTPYDVTAHRVDDKDQAAPKVSSYKLWDFSREFDDPETGLPVTEYLFVEEELDDDVHYFTVWIGRVIDPIKIIVV